MSSQRDGLLNTVQSFNYNQDATKTYKANPIDSVRFADWQRDHMYRSTYSQYHSKVHIKSIPRIRSSQEFPQSLSTAAIFHTLSLSLSMLRDIPP